MPSARIADGRRAETSDVWRSDPLTRAEKIVLLALVGTGALASVAIVLLTNGDPVAGLFQLGLTLAFALFAWSPLAAACVFASAVPLSYLAHSPQEALLACALAVGIVVRTGSRLLVASFAVVFLLAAAAAVLPEDPAAGGNLAAALLTAAVAGAVGLIIRLTIDRERRLVEKLAISAIAEHDAARAERQRIADELHDVIGHDLTIIAMHVRVLERDRSDRTRALSQAAIGDAASKALADLRRVVAENGDPAVPVGSGEAGLAQAMAEAESELRAAGHDVVIDGDPDDDRITRLVGRTLARVLRESVTNVLKHGRGGAVRIHLGVHGGAADLQIRSAVGGSRRADLPSGGYGTVRMAERARRLGGSFHAGPDGADWLVAVRIPLH